MKTELSLKQSAVVVLFILLGVIRFSAAEPVYRRDGELARVSRDNGEDEKHFTANRPSVLVLLQMLFRHGDRSPMHIFPWDQHSLFWAQGEGQLTQAGMQQAYDYGKQLRERYKDFLSQKYKSYELEVQSTDVDRTIMTAQCLLAGLFPTNFSWPMSPWQPIPVHTQMVDTDHLFSHAPCEKLDQLNAEYSTTTPSVLFDKKYQPLYDQLSHFTGTQVDRTTAHQIADMLYCESQHNLSRPNWMTDAMFQQLMNLRNETYTLSFMAPGSAQLSGGPMLAEMTKNMENRVDDPASTKKVFLFSAHDTNIANFGRALEIFNNLQPPYVTSIALELWRQDEHFFVRTLFDNHTTTVPFTMTIPGCEAYCPLHKFHDLLKHNMLPAADQPAACIVSQASKGSSHTITAVVIVVVVVAIAGVLLLVYKVKRARQSSSSRGHDSNFQYRQLLQPPDSDEDDDDDDRIDEL